MIFGELFMKHGAEDAVRAGDLLLSGPLSKSFWLFAVGLGIVLPVGIILRAHRLADSLVYGRTPAWRLFGLWIYEHLWIRARSGIAA